MQQNQTAVGWGVIGLGGVVVQQIAPAIVGSTHSKLVGCVGSTPETLPTLTMQPPPWRTRQGTTARRRQPAPGTQANLDPDLGFREELLFADENDFLTGVVTTGAGAELVVLVQ